MKQVQENYDHLTREAITKRFMRAVALVKSENRRDCKNDTQVAKAIGMSQQNMSKYAKGSQHATVEQIARFCEYFSVSDAFILRGEGSLEIGHPFEQRLGNIELQLKDLHKKFELVKNK